MDNQTVSKLKDIILKNQDIGVVVKSNPTLDEMAAGLGLFLTVQRMGKNASIACPTEPIVAVSSLVGIDRVQNSFGGQGGDLTVSFPYKEGEIEKVSYTLDNGQLNIVVKAGEKGLSFQQNEVKFIHGGKMPTLVFYVGIAHPQDAGALFTTDPNVTTVNIDNHADNEKYGQTVIVDPKWSSVSEQVADFVTLLEPQVEVDIDTAQNLLDGILFATQDFQSPRTSYLAFEVAGILMKKGATRQKAQSVAHQTTAPSQNNSQYFPPMPQPKPAAPLSAPMPSFSAQPPVQPMSQPTWAPAPAPVASAPVTQPFTPTQQPAVQPTQQFAPVQNQPFGTPPAPVAPVSSAPTQPIENTQGQQPAASHQAPPDWLTPKVYKGSTIL